MSGRTEFDRQLIYEAGSPLLNHSLNSKNTKDSLAGWKRHRNSRGIPPKVQRAMLRREGKMNQLIEERVQRTESWLTKAYETGYLDVRDFPQETSYLRKHGINIKSIIADSRSLNPLVEKVNL